MTSVDGLRAALAGLLAALVGYGSTFVLIMQGLAAVGADTRQMAGGLFAVCLLVGILAIVVALRLRVPVGIAWSTPGAALLIGTGALPGGYPVAVGALMLAGAMVFVAGLYAPLSAWITRIPPAIANAMLAGILLKLCLAPFLALGTTPWPALVLLAIYVVMLRLARLFAVPVAVLAAILMLVFDPAVRASVEPALPALTWVTPRFTWDGLVGLALPLFIVTMASQNIPGMAVLSVYGYRPQAGPLFRATGAVSVIGAPFGAISACLAAITAAILCSPDAGTRPESRYRAAVWAGVFNILLAFTAAMGAALVTAASPVLIQAAAGLALLGAFGSSLYNGLREEADRPAALVTLLVTASGIAPLGVGAAFWGLVGGLAVHAVLRMR